MEYISWLLYLFLPFFTLLYFFITTIKARSRLPLPPGPRPIPLFGNIFLLGDQPHSSMAKLAKVYGPIMTLRLGLTTTIVISSPEAAKEALQKKDQLLSDRWVPDAAQALGHHKSALIWSADNQAWRQLRAICTTNLFCNRSLEASKEIRRQSVRELVDYFRKRTGENVDVGHAVFATILSVISRILFSQDVGSKTAAEFRHLVSTLTQEAGKPNISDFFPALRPFDLQGRRRCVAFYLKRLYSMFDEIGKSRLRSSLANGTLDSSCFLDSLLQLLAESKINKKMINSVLADLFAAGTDTTSITLEWAITELLRNPGVLAKAQRELKEVIGSSKDEVDELDIARLPYLQAVVKEVLRLHPAGPLLLPHKASQDTELGGYLVPKGSRVLVNVWAIGRDENVWEQHEVFMPERFLKKEFDFLGRHFEFLPFGSGRRSCVGMPMAVKLLHLILASLLHAFEWKLPEGMEPGSVDVKEKFGASLGKAIPLQAVAIPTTCRNI